jgi:3-aminobutyryl-CoA ammonia-lyase
MAEDPLTHATLRVRLGTDDTHYRNYLIPAATILRLFADCSTQIGLHENQGYPNLLAGYEKADFFLTCRVGDYLEITCRVLSRGNRSKRVECKAFRHVAAPESEGGANRLCDPPELVASAVLISVRPRENIDA